MVTGRSAPQGAPAGVAFTRLLNDDMDGPLDRTKWNTFGSFEQLDGGRWNPKNGEQDFKTDGTRFNFVGSVCEMRNQRITPDRTTPIVDAAPYPWESSMFVSKQTFTTAWIEERAKFPAILGTCSALWTWPELDVYEYYSDNKKLLYIDNIFGSTKLDMSTSTIQGGAHIAALPSFDPSADFHVYGADVQPALHKIDFYVDGHLVYTNNHVVANPWQLISYHTTNWWMQNDPTGANGDRAPHPASGTNLIVKRVDWISAWKRS